MPELNIACNNIPYTLGRMFSLYEQIQLAAAKENSSNINATIKDRYFNSAAATPSVVFPTLLKLAQKHLQKMGSAQEIYYNKQITELMGRIHQTYPTRMTLPEQGAFELGYYHQVQERYTKKEEA